MTIQTDALLSFSAVHNIKAFHLRLPSKIGISLKVVILIGHTITGEKTITGSLMGSTRLSVDVPWLVALHKSARLKLDELITARYPLSQINDAIQAMESGSVLRNVKCLIDSRRQPCLFQ